MNNRASFIEIVTATFAAGESRLFALTGQYFEIIDATFPVDVTLSDIYGAQRGLMKSAEASFNLKGTDFGVIQITSDSAQTIRFAYGTGEAGTRRAAGAVSIVGTVPVDLVTADVDAIRRPEAPNGFATLSAALALNTPQTLIAPGVNVNGLIVYSAAFTVHQSGTTVTAQILAKSSAPASVTDGEVIVAVQTWNTGNSLAVNGQLTIPQYLAPGLGLFIIAPIAAANHLSSARWRAL